MTSLPPAPRPEAQSAPLASTPLNDLIIQRYGRRRILKGLAAMTTLSAAAPSHAFATKTSASDSQFAYTELSHGVDTLHHVAPGYLAEVLIRWGDPVTEDSPPFSPQDQTAEAQERQFGYNNDFIAYLPLPVGSNRSDHGLLFVNHEYTNRRLMFPALKHADGNPTEFSKSRSVSDIEMSAHGASIIEIKRTSSGWGIIPNSHYARRISARTTVMQLSGPAAGHPRLRTSADPHGHQVIGMLNNCAGGTTPWGTVLSCEEHFNGYFMGTLEGHPEVNHFADYGIPAGRYKWGLIHPRFDINQEPLEANRFGWVVEIDPYNPSSTPIKRTALGRFKHEGASSIVNHDGRLVVYTGDDEAFQFLYKYVSRDAVNSDDRTANATILDHGTLSVAQFKDDGTVNWQPLVWGHGPLTPKNGFTSQAEVLIETRRAARLLGATPMDRPEDIEPHPQTNKIYVLLTGNHKRTADQLDPPNPRAENMYGHIIELTPPNGDHGASQSRWDILVKCGDPKQAEVGAMFHPSTSSNGWFASPDNCAIDHHGRLWICTDQGKNWVKTGTADGVWGLETVGKLRGFAKMFFRAPVGAELCGPCFTPDDTTLFVAVQHPAADGAKAYPGFARHSTFADPVTRWPDFHDKMPPRPSVLAITKSHGGWIGS